MNKIVIALFSLAVAGTAFAQGNFVVARGLGAPNDNHVSVRDTSGSPVGVDFQAYGARQWGTNVATGLLDRVSPPYILTGPGPGEVYGPHTRGWTHDGSAVSGINFFGYGTLRYGVIPECGDLDVDELCEILTGPGPGAVFGPHVRGWRYTGTKTRPLASVNFFAYFTLRYGVNVESNDVDGDVADEIITGPGPSPVFGPQVRGWNSDGGTLRGMPEVNFNAYSLTFGVNLGLADVDGNGDAEILTAPGPGPSQASEFRGFDFSSQGVAALPGFQKTPFSTGYGGRVDGGPVTTVGELIAAAGRDPSASAQVKTFRYENATLTPTVAFNPFPGSTYGVNATSDWLGY